MSQVKVEMSSNSLILNRFFTHSVFQDLIKYEKSRVYSSIVAKYLANCASKSNAEIITEIYRLLSDGYRNEYFYKNTLLTKLLLRRHSVKTTVALTQIPIGKSKADFVLINGKAVVYEIKSELDTYNRLESQLGDYFRAFNHVCVVAPEDEFDTLNDMLSSTPVGIYCLTRRNTFSKSKCKEPTQHNSELEYRSIFRVLHKHEYEQIIEGHFKELPKVSQVKYYDACLDMFSSIPVLDAYQMSLAVMKKRNKSIAAQLKAFPQSLNSLLYFLNPSRKEIECLSAFLTKPFRGDG